jgi:hypothetical protein
MNLMMSDSSSSIATRELTRKQYESWTKKEFHDSITFLPVDYNSPQEADSSSSYLMKDVNGIGMRLNPDDSLTVIRYLEEIGFDSISKFEGHIRISNNNQFFELHLSKDTKSLSINRYYISLNKSVEKSTEVIGNSRIECDGNAAIWFFN